MGTDFGGPAEVGMMILMCNFLRRQGGKPIHPLHSTNILTANRIVELLMQLFWKQNKYAQNNLQYGGAHKQAESREGSRQNTTPSRESVQPTENTFIQSAFPDIPQAIPNKTQVDVIKS